MYDHPPFQKYTSFYNFDNHQTFILLKTLNETIGFEEIPMKKPW